MPAAIEIPSFDYADVENAFRRATAKARSQDTTYDRDYATHGFRFARERHPKLMKALERCAELLEAERERQMGQTQRRQSIDWSHRAVPMEVSAFREAYKAADRGRPIEQLMWLYGAAADLAGIQP